jgi:uncharacterized protein (TIGR00255 family)
MIRSMTGYGEAERETATGRLRVEIKTVNHRYFSANIRLPSALERHELQIREWVRAFIPRGHASIAVRLETRENGEVVESRLRLNEAKARQYRDLLQSLKDRLDLPGQVDVALLSRFGDLFERAEEPEPGIDAEALQMVVEDAARATVAMREQEGQRLRSDLEERLAAISAALTIITELAPARLLAEHARLRRVVSELAGDAAVDEDRLAREVAIIADRWDLGEELVRLSSHLELFRADLDSGEAQVGKRLGFLSQEMHRETNTIGSKSNDAAIDRQVVTIKNEIERLREQIENIE